VFEAGQLGHRDREEDMPALTDRQKNIIDAATRLLSERGIQELTLKSLAARVGVSEPALYRHFASKSEILKGVLDLFEYEIHAAVFPSPGIPDGANLPDAGEEAGAALGHFVSGIAATLVHRPELAALLFSEEVFRSEAELSERMYALMTRTRYAISSLVASGIASGEFRPDIDPPSISAALIGGIRFLCTLWRLGSFSSDLAKDIDALWGSLRTSIATRSLP
jgi:AcrR family transcriptional regulator